MHTRKWNEGIDNDKRNLLCTEQGLIPVATFVDKHKYVRAAQCADDTN